MIADIWNSFRSLSLWVQIWVALILVPTNLFSMVFIDQPSGKLIAFLAVTAMAPNVAVIFIERGFSKLMALPHIPLWTILLVILLFWRPTGSPQYQMFLSVLFLVNLVSLIFDYMDAYKWWRGDRKIAGAR